MSVEQTNARYMESSSRLWDNRRQWIAPSVTIVDDAITTNQSLLLARSAVDGVIVRDDTFMGEISFIRAQRCCVLVAAE
jgi:hypothetical protein